MPAVTLQARWLAIRASRPPVEIMILTGQHGDRVAAALPRWIDGTPVSIVPSGSDGTVAAVSCGLGFATTDRVLCLNSDTIIGCELGGLLAYWPMAPRAMTLLCSEYPEAPNRGEVVIEHDRLVRMQPSPGAPPDHPTPLMANVGVYLFSRDRVVRSVADAPVGASIERYLVNRLAAKNLVGVQSLGDVPVIDFGTERGWQALQGADPNRFEILQEVNA